MKYPILFFLIFATFVSKEQIITVKQDGTGDFTTIQSAIRSAANGDTVLVYPGIYYENVDFLGKSLTLGSLTLTTGDVNYKYTTIIDGNHTGSCILLKSYETGVVINGFTLQHGSGYPLYQDYDTYGGALYMDHAHAEIYNCVVQYNKVTAFTGGLKCDNHSSLYLSGVSIHDNQALMGGGLSIGPDSDVTFDSINRCSMYTNYSGYGNDIYVVKPDDSVHFYLDTFTVAVPTPYFLSYVSQNGVQIKKYTFDCLHAYLEPVNADLYVNPVTGNDTNPGTSPDSALRTVAFAYTKIKVDSSKINTIHLANGLYSDSTNGEKFPLNIRPYIYVIGESKNHTILDAAYKTRIATAFNNTSHYGFKKLTFLRGGHVKQNNYSISDGAVKIYESNDHVVFDSCTFKDGWNSTTGTLYTIRSSVRITNSVFENSKGGRGLRVEGSIGRKDTAYIINCILDSNHPDTANPQYPLVGGALGIHGGGFVGVVTGCLFTNNDNIELRGMTITDTATNIYLTNCTFFGNNIHYNWPKLRVIDGNLQINNCIYYNEGGNKIEVYQYYIPDSLILSITHSLIEGGLNTVHVVNKTKLCYDSTNIDTDPLFYGGEEYPYNLSAESPCIDAGTLDLPQFILDNMPDTDLAGNPRIVNGKIDMGAYEWNPTVDVKQHKLYQKPNRLTAFPNPFRNRTTVTARWNKPANVTLSVYNNNGLLVKTLQTGNQPPGSFTTTWDGSDNRGALLPAGIYHIVLTVNGTEKENLKVVKIE